MAARKRVKAGGQAKPVYDPSQDPSKPSAAYEIMLPRWTLADALLGGTETMRAAREEYLPQYTAEDNVVYEARLSRAVLYEGFTKTVSRLTGRVFSEPLQLLEDVPEVLVALAEDIDLQGSQISVFANEWFSQGLAKGLCHVLVDMPRAVPREDGRQRTRADDLAEKRRPYWTLILPENVIHMSSTFVNGREVLTQVRIKESVVEENGFEEIEVEQIRVLRPGSVEIYRRETSGGKQTDRWIVHESWETGFPSIPLITFYAGRRQRLMLCKPPLQDLAYLNVLHWQSHADQQNILTVARFPMLAASGVEDAEGVEVGPYKFLTLPDPTAKYYYVEPECTSIDAGQKSLEDLEDKMESYGGTLLQRRPGSVTATEKAIDTSENVSELEVMATVFKDCVETALMLTAQWQALGEDAGGSIELSVDTSDYQPDSADLSTLEKARDRRDISRKAYIEELQRRGIISEDYDPEDDEAQIEQELTAFAGAALSDLAAMGGEVEEGDGQAQG